MKKNYLSSVICLFLLLVDAHAQTKNFSHKGNVHNQSNTFTTAKQNWSINPFEAKEFVENKGQFANNEDNKNDQILFSANVTGIKLYFNATGLTYEYDKAPDITEAQRDQVESGKKKPQDLPQLEKEFFGVQWLNANPNPEVVSEDPLSYYYTYPQGTKDNKTFIAKAYKKVLYKNIYPNIDIEYSFAEGEKEGIKYAIILHPGADVSNVKLVYENAEKSKINGEGNVVMKSLFGKFMDHAPKAFSEDNTPIESSFILIGNQISFKLGNYDHNKTLIIDPWTTSPAMTGINSAYDLDYDKNGNVYVYGGQSPYQLKKLNSAGAIQWVSAPTSASNTTAYGDFAVDHVSGTSYVGEGIDYSNAKIFKVNALGVQTGVYNGTTNMIEIWRMEYNSCIKEIVIGTGNTSEPYQAAILDTTMTAVTPVNVFGATSGYHDICLLAIDNDGSNCYIATTQSLLGAGAGFNNTLAKCPLPSLGPTSYVVNDGYAFQEIGSITYADGVTGTANGMNGMAASPNWLYMYDGAKLKRLNKASGAIVSTTTVTATSFKWGGLDVDQCDDVYLGNNANIDVYDSLLNQTGTIAASGAVYDLRLAPNNLMYACGKGFVSSFTVVAPVLTITIARTPASACVACNGTATANLSGCGSSSTSYNYLWSNGQTTKTATGLCAGNYTVTISSNCEPLNTDTVNIMAIPGASSVSVVGLPTSICPGSSSVLTATAPAGSTYSWSPGAGTTQSITVTPATTTTYTVTGTTTGCTSTATVTITVNANLAVTVNSPSICNGASATLTAVAPAGSTYSWSTTATTAAITVNPVATTSYTVTATSSTGCTGSAVATVTVNPLPTITVNSPSVCSGTSATLMPAGGTTYSWSTGVTTATITVTPTTTTSYTVTGTDANGCTNTALATVTVNPLPTVTVNSISICPTTSGTLTATGASTYAWAPALGLSGTTGASVTANPTVTTSYTVTGTDVNGCTGTAVAVVTLNGTLTVTVNSPSICLGAAGTLTATGPPAGSTYSWSDGETTNPITVTPAATTSYTVTGTSPSGCTGSAVATVTVNPLPPVTVNSPSICTGTSTSLTGVGAETYSWTAGLSGTTGTTVTANPVTTTSYTVTGTDANGCTNTAVSTVTVNPSPAPSFTSTTVCFNNATAFTDASTTTVGTITAWSWNFGEPSSGANNTSTTQNPTHTYGSSGTFNVKLIVTNSTGCIDSVTLPIIVNPLPIASFTTASVCSGTAMNFTDASTISSGTITGWAWNFGDPGSGVNNTSTVQSPSHTFNTAGNYVVTLTVTSNNGCQGTTTQTVTVNPIPVAAFTATSVCATTAMSFTDGSTVATGTITSWAWNFGDGGTSTVQTPTHTYATSGNFTVTLTVTGTGGCTNTVTNTVTVFPNPVASFTSTSVCLNNITDFTDGSTVSAGTITGWAWTFGDGTSSTLQNPTHTYAASGVYNVTLTVTSSNGCSNIISGTATVYPLPVAAFTNTTVCQNSPTSFTDASTISSGSITNWSWTFGDGNTSTAQSPLHLYAIDSTYIVKLVVTSNNGCVDSITQNVTVNPNPVVAFTVNDSAGCAPLCVDFTDHSTVANGGTINSWLWNYGDGNTGTSENPGHCYTAPGSYDVMLTVTSNNNCSTTYTHNNMINVYPVPVAAFTMNPQTATMENPLISFVDQSTGATGWHWNFGDGDTLTWGANDNNPTHAYGDTGVFNVQLIVINQFGCTDTATHPIYIEPTFTFYAPNAFTPNGDGINDTFYGTGTGIVAYEMWIFDRWGNLIFHTTNLNDQWNGIVMGGSRIAQIDVYVWKVKLTDVFQKDHQYIGHVSLVR